MSEPIRVRKIVIEAPGAPSIGALGGRSWFPAPQFGAECVCCDAPAQPIAYDPGGDQQSAETVAVPMCQLCRPHIPLGHRLPVFVAGLTGGIGVLAILASLVLGSTTMLLAGAAMIAAVVVWFILDGRSKQAAARRGHHRDFLVGVGGGFCVVRTTNPRLAQELLARHHGASHLLP